jgi:hypothetical protein
MTVHIMCDIETLGTRPGAVVLSAALVRFSDEAHCTVNISVPEQQALGSKSTPRLMRGGAGRIRRRGRTRHKTRCRSLSALQYLDQWIQWAAGGSDWLIWCHGATFDCPLLDELYRRAGVPSPWSYWQVRDTRTLYDLAGVNPKDYAVPPPHIALNDALGQSRAANEALRRIYQTRVAA